MSNIDVARTYLKRCDPAVSGQKGHDALFWACRVAVLGCDLSVDEARPLILDYNAKCVPPWSETEIEHKLREAESKPFHLQRGWLLHGRKHVFKDRQKPQKSARREALHEPKPEEHPEPPTAASLPMSVKPVVGNGHNGHARRYETTRPVEVPPPLPDGTRQLLRALFREGEGVGVCKAVRGSADDARERPQDAGVVLSREEWLRKLDEADGDPARFLSGTEKLGVYLRLNPMVKGGKKDADVTAYRHALIEFDDISLPEQWNILTQSRIPCTAITHSGNKSLHALVRVDASNAIEYAERVKFLLDHFAPYGVDKQNRNPSRFTRLPGIHRREGFQSLLCLKIGASNWTEWLAEKSYEELPEAVSIDSLLDFDPAQDPNTLLGNRWVCRGGSLLIIGQSGIGKSTFGMQACVTWGLGKPLFGIKPVKPLKSLLVQSENDHGDLAEMLQGVVRGMGLSLKDPAARTAVKERVTIVPEASRTGDDFCDVLEKLIHRHRPDLVWCDPLMGYVGDDLSEQYVCSHFFRNRLNPILQASGVALVFLHHTPKPPKNPRDLEAWSDIDMSYLGAGSADLMNWARAIAVVLKVDKRQQVYKILMTKRGKRAGLCDSAGMPQQSIYVQHSDSNLYWTCSDYVPPAKEGERSKFKVKFDTKRFLELYDPGKPDHVNQSIICADMDMSARTYGRLKDRLISDGKES